MCMVHSSWRYPHRLPPEAFKARRIAWRSRPLALARRRALVASQTFNVHFLLATGQDGTSQITDEGNLLSNGGAFDTAGSLLMQKARASSPGRASHIGGRSQRCQRSTDNHWIPEMQRDSRRPLSRNQTTRPNHTSISKRPKPSKLRLPNSRGSTRHLHGNGLRYGRGLPGKYLDGGAATPTDFWSDAGYCRGLAQ